MLCLRFAGTGRGFAWKEKDTLAWLSSGETRGGGKKTEAQKAFLACPSTPALCFSNDSWHTNENKLKGEDENLSLL